MTRARILAFTASLIVSLWSRTIKVRFVNKEIRDRFKAEGKNFIYAFWHGDMFLLLHSNRNSSVLIPVSESSDGDIMAGLLKHFGFAIVRGSSFRNGHKALFGMISGVRSGATIGMAVDGPRGPLHEVKKGVAFLASRLKLPVIPIASAAKRSWVLEKTWEKLALPVPFTEGVIVFGDPVYINGTSDQEIESGRAKLEQALRSLTLKAQENAATDGAVQGHDKEYGYWIAGNGGKRSMRKFII